MPIPLLLKWSDIYVIKTITHALRQEKKIITSTDTVPGLLARVTSSSFSSLCSFKKREDQKPFLLLIKNSTSLSSLVDPSALSDQTQTFLSQCWPGPVTIIFRAHPRLPSFVTSKKGTIALRSPQHNGLQRLLHHFRALFSTSANEAGKKAPRSCDEINKTLFKRVDYIVQDNEKRFSREKPKPSTLLDMSYRGEIIVIRKGSYPLDRLEKLYGKTFTE